MENSNIQQLLEKYEISPNKVLGQNFLIDENAVHLFIDAANISEDDIVIEVGPGTGTITKELAKKAGAVIAVEKDPNMVKILKDELGSFDNITVLQEDILKFSAEDLELFQNSKFLPAPRLRQAGKIENSDYKVVGAPPYYLTSRLFRKFMEHEETMPSLIAVIIQKEVAEKIVAKSPNSNLLANSVQLYGEAKIIKKIPKNSFWPQPKVDSAILIIENIKKPNVNEKLFFRVLKAGFSSPRKQLLVNLSSSFSCSKEEAGEWLKKSNIEPTRRAQTLSIEEWETLVDKAQKEL